MAVPGPRRGVKRAQRSFRRRIRAAGGRPTARTTRQTMPKQSPGVTPPGTGNFILMENSGYILLESGDKILLET